jgi:serine/threonine-protein kinase
MGAIYLGKKVGPDGFERELVLKQLLPEFTSRPEFRDLFFREAKISATLDHVNIVRTLDLVRSDEALFIVMEYVPGTDLRTICWRARRKRKALSTAAILHVALEILAGLAYAHGRRSLRGEPLGIVHRDVSPSNILCSAHGEVKLSDFGIAKAVTYSSTFYRVRGKVGYMSPEQARNQPLDARSDLFSVAVCIYETLLGERLYTGDLQTPADVIYAQPIPSLTERCPHLPPELEGVMRRGLALQPEQRFPDAATFAQALREITRRHGLVYSPPQLAAELTSLLGVNCDRWLVDDSGASVISDGTAPPRELEGKEASSIGIVEDDIADPQPAAIPAAAAASRVPSGAALAISPAVFAAAAVWTPQRSFPVNDAAALSTGVLPPSSRRRVPGRLFWASTAAALLVGLIAVGLLSRLGDEGPLSSVMKSLRHKIVFWTD